MSADWSWGEGEPSYTAGGKGSLHTLRVGTWTGTATVKFSVGVPDKSKADDMLTFIAVTDPAP